MGSLAFMENLQDFSKTLMETQAEKSLDSLWISFRETLHVGINKFIPQNTLSSKTSLSWMTQ